MKFSKIIFFVLIFTLLLSSFSQIIFSVGVGTRSNRRYIFEPNMNINFDFFVRNTRNEPHNIFITLEGNTTPFKSDLPKTIRLNSQSTTTSVNLKLPDKMDVPGTHTFFVVFDEMPDSMNSGMFATKSSIRTPFYVRVRNSGLYLEGSLSALSVAKGDMVPITAKLDNYGSVDINQITVYYNIYDPAGKLITTLSKSSTGVLKRDATFNLINFWNSLGFEKGEYFVDANVNYDGKTLYINKTKFRLGDVSLVIQNFTDEVQAGAINRFEIFTESEWANPLLDVYGYIIIYSKDGQSILYEGKTQSYSFKPWEKKTMLGYVDMTNIPIGEYPIDVILKYGDSSTQKRGILKVVKEKASQVYNPQGFFSFQMILIIVLILLMLLNLWWFFFFARKKKKEDEVVEEPKKIDNSSKIIKTKSKVKKTKTGDKNKRQDYI